MERGREGGKEGDTERGGRERGSEGAREKQTRQTQMDTDNSITQHNNEGEREYEDEAGTKQQAKVRMSLKLVKAGDGGMGNKQK